MSTLHKLFFAFTLLLAFYSAIAQGYGVSSIITDRPTQTVSPTVVPANHLQLENGFIFQKEEFQEGEEYHKIYALNSLWRFHLTDWMELRLVMQPEQDDKYEDSVRVYYELGFSALQAGLKFSILRKTEDRPGIGLVSMLASAAARLDNYRGVGWINTLTVDHNLSSKMNLNWNLGLVMKNGPADILYSLNWRYNFYENFSVFIEPYGRYENMYTLHLNADAGLTTS